MHRLPGFTNQERRSGFSEITRRAIALPLSSSA